MVITVNPCFHWIGYHISTGLLQEGVEVIGIDRMTHLVSEHLYMYVGRNSNFQHFYNSEDKEKHVHRGEEEMVLQFMDHQLLIEKRGEDPFSKWIDLPELYGEWMDMTKLGVQEEEDLSEWVEERDAVYIADFIRAFIPSILNGEEPAPSSTFRSSAYEEERERNIEAVWNTHVYQRSLGLT